jgi:predicted Zn-dependent peptidase
VDFRLTGEAVDDVLWHLREDGLRPGELEGAKKRLLLDSYLADKLSARAVRLAQYATFAALPQARRYPDDIQAVTAADVQRVVRFYFSPENRVVGITGVAHQEGVRHHKGTTP